MTKKELDNKNSGERVAQMLIGISDFSLFSVLFSIFRLFSVRLVAHGGNNMKGAV